MKSFAVTTLACLSLNTGLSLAGPVAFNEKRAACGDSCDTLPSKRSIEHIPRQNSRSRPGSVPYGSIITRCSSPGQVALTYDDGPWSYTSQLLDTLGSYGVKATFFLNGNGRGQGGFSDAAQPWGDLLKRMNSAGHQLASHTWSHQSLNAVDDSTRRSEMANNEQAFSDLLGFFPTYMRAPYLECAGDCQALLNELGYHIIDTNLDTKDYENDSPELIQVSKDRFSAGLSTDAGSNDYIVLSHDVHYQTVESLTAYMIELSIERGYKLVTVGECLGDPSSNWYRTADGSTGGSGGGSGTTNPPTDPPSTPSNPTTPTFTSIVKSDPKPTSEPSTSGLTVSPNARCGDDTGYTCVGSAYGDCCGFYGFCGSTETYCGTGCRAGPGKCWTLGDGPTSNTDVPESKDTKPSTDGRCGASSGTTCEGYGSDHCCSSYGYCGVSSDHCGAGCQSAFGTCN